MSIKLRTMYKYIGSLYRATLAAGEGGLDNMVSWVHIMEDASTADFLRGSELVITTGVEAGGSTSWLLQFIRALRRAGACGLVVNVGRYIPALPPEVVEYSRETDFPLFTIPWEIHLVDIVRDCCNRIFSEESLEESTTRALSRALSAPEATGEYVPYLTSRQYPPEGVYRAMVVHDGGQLFADGDDALRFAISTRNLLNRHLGRYHLFFYENRCVIICHRGGPETDITALPELLSGLFDQRWPGHRFCIGLGPEVGGLELVYRSYRRALAALGYARISGQTTASFDQMGTYRILLSTEDTSLLREIMEESLGPLIAYDRENGTDNLEVLRFYIESNFSVQEVASKTFTHRNTVNYRIRKIKEILGSDLEDMDEKLRLLLAYYIRDIL